MASIPLNLPDLDAALTSTWRPFLLTSQIWTPHRRRIDATHSSTWRPFHIKSPIWTPPTSAHGVHFSLHPQSGRRTNSHMASIPLNIPNLDAAPTLTWRPIRLKSQIWTPTSPAHGVHSAQHPQSGRRPDAAQTQPARWAYIFQKIPLSDIKMHNFIPLLKSDESYCTMALTTIRLEIGGQLSGYCRAMGVGVFKFLNVDFERGVGVYGY